VYFCTLRMLVLLDDMLAGKCYFTVSPSRTSNTIDLVLLTILNRIYFYEVTTVTLTNSYFNLRQFLAPQACTLTP